MSVTRKIIGRLPIYFGDYDPDKAGGYGIKNRVTMFGSEFESKIEGNTYPPAEYDETEGTVTFDEVHWAIISNGTDAWLAGKRLDDLEENSIIQKEEDTPAGEDDRYYIVDKNKTILGWIEISTGARYWLQKNEEELHAADIIERASTEVEIDGFENCKFLVDDKNNILAYIKEDGEVYIPTLQNDLLKRLSEEVDIEGYDNHKFLVSNNGLVIGKIDNEGGVYFYNFKNQTASGSDELTKIMTATNSCGRNARTLNMLNRSTKGYSFKEGVEYKTVPFISFHDDDTIDYQLPESYVFGSTRETRVSPGRAYWGIGFASFLYVFMKSITERHRTDLKGKLVFGLAAEGQRIGLLDKVYSDMDTFDGKLNSCGEMARKLHTRCGWDIMCHSMTARYIANSYWVSSINDPLVTAIAALATKGVQNWWENSYIHCEDTNLDYEYRIDDNDVGEWHLVSYHYLRPYLAKSLDSDATLYFNPRYSTYYQFGEWKRRAAIAGLPFLDAVVYPGSSPCRKHIVDSMEYFKYPVLGQQEHINNQPLDQTCIRRFHYHPKTGNNAWNDSTYNSLIKKVDECIENKSWLILTSHANDIPNRNLYVNGVDYGERRDDSYPAEWIVPLNQEELETIDENNYWEVPPARLGINSWAEWYPCPGTTYDMLLHVIEYAIERGVEFGSTEEGIKRFGNMFMLGLKYTEQSSADRRLADSEVENSLYNYIIQKSDGSIEKYVG